MLFNTWFGSLVQTHPHHEGGRLIAAGFLRPVMDGGYAIGVEATQALRRCFRKEMPPMERLYPVLVAFVACCRFPEMDDGRAQRELRELGMSEEGIEALRQATQQAAR